MLIKFSIPCPILSFKQQIVRFLKCPKQENVIERTEFETSNFKYDLFTIQVDISAVAATCK